MTMNLIRLNKFQKNNLLSEHIVGGAGVEEDDATGR